MSDSIIVRVKRRRPFVLGFLYSTMFSDVVLIKKTHPDWQAGKWNGIGGQVNEGEAVEEAMSRECFEEVDLAIAPASWHLFANLYAYGDRIFCFWAETSARDLISKTDELASFHPVDSVTDRLSLESVHLVEGVRWLVSMSLEVAFQDSPKVYTIEHGPLGSL